MKLQNAQYFCNGHLQMLYPRFESKRINIFRDCGAYHIKCFDTLTGRLIYWEVRDYHYEVKQLLRGIK